MNSLGQWEAAQICADLFKGIYFRRLETLALNCTMSNWRVFVFAHLFETAVHKMNFQRTKMADLFQCFIIQECVLPGKEQGHFQGLSSRKESCMFISELIPGKDWLVLTFADENKIK